MSASSLTIKQAAKDDVRDIADFMAYDNPRSAEYLRIEFKQAIERIRAFSAQRPSSHVRQLGISIDANISAVQALPDRLRDKRG